MIGCRCLSESRLYREAFEHLPGLLKSGRGLNPAPVIYLAARRFAREALEQVIALEEQRAREQAAYHAFIRNLYENPHPRFACSGSRRLSPGSAWRASRPASIGTRPTARGC